MKKLIYSLFTLTLLLGMTACEEKPLDGKPTLSASKMLFVADGEEGVEFTVKVGDVDVTAESIIYANNVPINGNVFTTTEAKDYKFFATYNGGITNQITIKAANPALYLELPEDPQADKFDGFHHNVLFTQLTGTWCGYCPLMIRSIELFLENGSNAANTVVVAAHNGDELSSDASETVVSTLKPEGLPSSYFSLNPNILIENNYPEVNSEIINSTAGMELKEKANAGIAATVATNKNKSVVAVRAAVKIGKTDTYRVNAWLVENSVTAYQSSYWEGFTPDYIKHDHVLRAASCVSPIQGELLAGKSTCQQGDTYEFYHEFDAAEANIVDAANCKVVVLVTTGTGKSCYVNNIIECPVGESVPFAYN